MSEKPPEKKEPLWKASLLAAIFCGVAIAAVMVQRAYSLNPDGVFKDYLTGQINIAALGSVYLQWQIVGTLLFWPITTAALWLKRN